MTPEAQRIAIAEACGWRIVQKTCQTCKHWGNAIKQDIECFAPKTRGCKQIFKSISASNYDLKTQIEPHIKWFTTRATFGCNEYQSPTQPQ